jgi:predicted aspartyl protease
MGTFRHQIVVARLDGGASETVEALVDTGATYTWIPRQTLDRLGVTPTGRRRLQLADGQIIERESGLVLITVDGITVATTCIFGDPGSLPLMGAVTLEECGLAPDPVRQLLIPTVGLLASLATNPSAGPGA